MTPCAVAAMYQNYREIYSLHLQGKVSQVDISFYLCPLWRAGCYFSPGSEIAVLVRAKGFHWNICTLFSVSLFMTDWLCLALRAHFAIPFYITSHLHNSTLTSTLKMEYVPLSQSYPSTTLHSIIIHAFTCTYHFLAVYNAHSSLYHNTLYRNYCLKHV